MRPDNYDDRDEYNVSDDYAGQVRRNGNRSMRKQAKGAAGRDAMEEGGSAKQRSSHNWPPRSKYRIRPW